MKHTEGLVTFADVKKALYRFKGTIIIGTVACALVVFMYASTRSINYAIQASFKEKSRSQIGNTGILFNFMNNIPNSEAASVMRSKTLWREIADVHYINASIHSKSYFETLLDAFKKNIQIEMARWQGKEWLVLVDKPELIKLTEVKYNDDVPLSVKLQFISEDTFEIVHPFHSPPITSQLGKPCYVKNAVFTLLKHGEGSLQNQLYTLQFNPIEMTISQILNSLNITVDKEDKNLLKLVLKYPDRLQGAELLNDVMSLYQKFAYQEHQRISEMQLNYLFNRQDEMQNKLREMMLTHGKTLSANALNMGFLGVGSAIDFLTEAKQKYTKDILDIDIECKSLLDTIAKKQLNLPDLYKNAPEYHEILTTLHTLKQRAEVLERILVDEQNGSVSDWIFDEKLANGITLETANDFFIEYAKNLDEIEEEILKRAYILKRMHEPGFEISSLSNTISDPVAQKMLDDTVVQFLSVRDQHNHSPKEVERLQGGLEVQKNFLMAHLEQTIQLSQLHKDQLKMKICALLKITYELIKREINVLEERLKDVITLRMNNLQVKKSLISEHMNGLQLEMSRLPNQWIAEKLIVQQTELNTKMIEEITKLVESKNISRNLELVQSAPLDMAKPPLQANAPHLLLATLFGAGGGFVLSCIVALGFSLRRKD